MNKRAQLHASIYTQHVGYMHVCECGDTPVDQDLEKLEQTVLRSTVTCPDLRTLSSHPPFCGCIIHPLNLFKFRHRGAGSVCHYEINTRLYTNSCVWVFIKRSVSYAYTISCLDGSRTRWPMWARHLWLQMAQFDAFIFTLGAYMRLELAI